MNIFVHRIRNRRTEENQILGMIEKTIQELSGNRGKGSKMREERKTEKV